MEVVMDLRLVDGAEIVLPGSLHSTMTSDVDKVQSLSLTLLSSYHSFFYRLFSPHIPRPGAITLIVPCLIL